MKIHLLVTFLVAIAACSVEAKTYTARVATDRAKPKERPAPALRQPDLTGVIPRAIRGGNPLQMLNPRAPAKYGTAQEAVSYDQNDPAKWRGIKFFEFRF